MTVGLVLSLASVVAACAPADPFLNLSGDQLWAAGQAAYEAEDWGDVVLTLQRFTAQAPGHSRIPEARMYLARAHEERREYLSAASEYDRFLQVHYNHPLAPQASIGECKAYQALVPIPERDQTPTRTALDVCRRTAREFPGGPEAEEAQRIATELTDQLAEAAYLQADSYRRIGHLYGAIQYWESLVLLEYQESPWAPRALLAMYRAYKELEWEEEAAETIDRLMFNFPDSPSAAELQMELDEEREPESVPAAGGSTTLGVQ